ncbi:hypothetical protein, partial [Burkholderia alba]|uniref:hypothetical protein n=1 Tax=Burkholderia alba TaxID=2683677 RepID=UPI002B055A14
MQNLGGQRSGFLQLLTAGVVFRLIVTVEVRIERIDGGGARFSQSPERGFFLPREFPALRRQAAIARHVGMVTLH